MKNKFLKGKLAAITGDFSLNILASVIYTFSRQILVFPLLAASLSDAEYGTVLTVAGIVNVLIALVGSTLNNIRLIKDPYYSGQTKKGDFQFLCLIGTLFGALGCLILGKIFSLPLATVLTLMGYVAVSNFYHYGVAYFRLALDFKRSLIASILISLGYAAACLLFISHTWWPMILLTGESVGLVYAALSSRFYKEGLAPTPQFSATAKTYLQLACVNLVSNLLMYADRLILYPLLGSESVSYYSTAAFFGKSAGIVMTPIAGVLLGYFSQKNFTASKKLFMLVNGISLGFLGVFLLGCWLLAPWFTKLLYPSLYEPSLPYIFLANLGAVAAIAGNMAQPMLLKACPTRYLMGIQIFYGAIYVFAAYWLMPLFGLFGFCYATIIANTVRLLALYLLGLLKL